MCVYAHVCMGAYVCVRAGQLVHEPGGASARVHAGSGLHAAGEPEQHCTRLRGGHGPQLGAAEHDGATCGRAARLRCAAHRHGTLHPCRTGACVRTPTSMWMSVRACVVPAHPRTRARSPCCRSRPSHSVPPSLLLHCCSWRPRDDRRCRGQRRRRRPDVFRSCGALCPHGPSSPAAAQPRAERGAGCNGRGAGTERAPAAAAAVQVRAASLLLGASVCLGLCTCIHVRL